MKYQSWTYLTPVVHDRLWYWIPNFLVLRLVCKLFLEPYHKEELQRRFRSDKCSIWMYSLVKTFSFNQLWRDCFFILSGDCKGSCANYQICGEKKWFRIWYKVYSPKMSWLILLILLQFSRKQELWLSRFACILTVVLIE